MYIYFFLTNLPIEIVLLLKIMREGGIIKKLKFCKIISVFVFGRGSIRMAKKIFISYSWDDEEHEKWVAQLANDLRSKYGLDAICDTICNASKLNDMMINGITKSDKVIVVITPNYTNRAENRMGGVGKETGLLFDRYFDNDVVPIIKEKASLPVTS